MAMSQELPQGPLGQVRAGAAACAAALARLRADVETLAAAQRDLEAGLAALEAAAATAPVAGTSAPTTQVAHAPPVQVPAVQGEPAESGAAPVEAGDAAATALCDHLEGLHARLNASGLGHDPADVLFMVKARAVLSGAGAQRAVRLLDLLGFLDRVGAVYCASAYLGLQTGVEAARGLLAACLPGYVFITTADAGAPTLPLRAPLIFTTGVMDGTGRLVRPPQIAAAGAPAQVTEPVGAGWALAEEAGAAMARAYRKAVREDCSRLVEDVIALAQPDPARDEANALRSLLNLHTRVCESAAGPAVKRVLDAVKSARGWRALTLEPGERFDPERHDAKRFDRQGRGGSGKPAGTVLGLRQIGLLDTAGLPVQKCILVTAE